MRSWARWTGKARLTWQHAHASLWFIPALLVVAAATLSTVLLWLDGAVGTGYAAGWWLFEGSASGARTVLSVIAGSLITVVAVAFSVTMIAIQQASTQYTPRVLRTFTRDRGNQVVLGTYIATFAYALLVLRRVRDAEVGHSAFVPSISISAAMLLALVSLGMLVYFIHHVAEALQVETLLGSIRRELDRELRRLFPEAAGEGRPEPTELEAPAGGTADRAAHEVVVRCREEGHLRHIQHHALADAARFGARLIRIEVRIGEYVRPGDVLLHVWSDEPPDDAFGEQARGAFRIDRERSLRDDPLFGIRQIVDIGVKALSPGVNDPTTAEQALDHLGGAMVVLLGRSIPSPLRVLEGGVRVLFKAPTFADYVEACFDQIRRAARSDLHVTRYLLAILDGLLARANGEAQAAPLRKERDRVKEPTPRATRATEPEPPGRSR